MAQKKQKKYGLAKGFLNGQQKSKAIGRRKLRMLNNSQNLADLRIPPSNRLEKLQGNLKDYYSIRINDQWRIIFQWDKGQASQVEITDYH